MSTPTPGHTLPAPTPPAQDLAEPRDELVRGEQAPADFLTLGRKRYQADPQRVADATFRYLDGSQVTVKTSNEVIDQFKKTRSGTLDSFTARGHGKSDLGVSSMSLDTNDPSAPGFESIHADGHRRVTIDQVQPGGTIKAIPFGPLVKGKFAPGGSREVNLEACETGNWHGLSQTMAETLPGLQTRGTAGVLLENGITGAVHPAAGPDAARVYVRKRSEFSETEKGTYNPFPDR